MRRKKFLKMLLIITLLFVLNSCYYKDLSDDEEIVMATNPAQTVVFVENESGYTSNLRFIIKTKLNDTFYIKEGKYYNGQYTYSTIVKDRDFELLSCFNQTLFLSNENGLHEIKYKEKKSWLEDVIISDSTSNYRQNGFNEVIRVINENKYVSPSDLDIQFGYLDTQTISDDDMISTIKRRIYVYRESDNLYYFTQATKRVVDRSGSKIDEFTLEPEMDVEILKEIDVKKVLVGLDDEVNYIYVVDQMGVIRVVNSKSLKTIQYHHAGSVQAFTLFENFLVVVSNNMIYIFDNELNVVSTCEATSQVLGITWYKDPSISCIKYAIADGNDIKILNVNI